MWGVRFSPEQRTKIDAFATENQISRAEAIRRLIGLGLER